MALLFRPVGTPSALILLSFLLIMSPPFLFAFFLPLHLVVSAPYRAAPYRGAPELFSSVSQLVLLVGALSVRAVLFVVPVLPPASASFAGVWWFGFRFGFGFG